MVGPPLRGMDFRSLCDTCLGIAVHAWLLYYCIVVLLLWWSVALGVTLIERADHYTNCVGALYATWPATTSRIMAAIAAFLETHMASERQFDSYSD